MGPKIRVNQKACVRCLSDLTICRGNGEQGCEACTNAGVDCSTKKAQEAPLPTLIDAQLTEENLSKAHKEEDMFGEWHAEGLGETYGGQQAHVRRQFCDDFELFLRILAAAAVKVAEKNEVHGRNEG